LSTFPDKYPFLFILSLVFIRISCKGLARMMGQKYRRTLDSMNGKTVKRKEATEQGEVVPGQQKRQKKRLIGVVRVRFYPPKDTDVAPFLQALDAIEDNTVAARENVYKDHREAVQRIFNLSPDIKTCVTGFFDDPIHCQTHFEYLAETSILDTVEGNFSDQFDDIQSVLNVWARTEASKQRMEAARVRCLELQGSKIPLYVCFLRELTQTWHQKLGGFVRFPDEEEMNSPHLLCVERPGDMVFDIHLEQRKVLSGMKLTTAIASFFHLAFIGQLKYPPEGEAVAILLQRKLAKVDPEGKIKI
jgi:hypothetical protein